MKVLLIGNTKSYESRRIQEEFSKRDIDLELLAVKDFVIEIENNNPKFTTKDNRDLEDFDAYLFRGMGNGLWEMMVFARHLYMQGKTIVEEKLATERALMTKLSYTLAKNGFPVIDTKVIFDLDEGLEKTLEFPLVAKGTVSSRGRSVFKVNNIEELKKIYEEVGPKLILQKYIPISYDYRVFIVGDEVLGVMKRFNSDENFLTNISAGGRAEASELPIEVLQMCIEAKKLKKTEIAGVDVIEYKGTYFILEINTSPQFQGLETATEVNVAAKIVEYVLSKSKK